jgi:hypothetical protein
VAGIDAMLSGRIWRSRVRADVVVGVARGKGREQERGE